MKRSFTSTGQLSRMADRSYENRFLIITPGLAHQPLPLMNRSARARATLANPRERIKKKPMPKSPELPPIHTVRSQRVVLDGDLARLYGVSTMVFNQAIKRNIVRFPEDFIFRLTREEYENLISQFVISSFVTSSCETLLW